MVFAILGLCLHKIYINVYWNVLQFIGFSVG